jgi:hypothetical protein
MSDSFEKLVSQQKNQELRFFSDEKSLIDMKRME